MAKMGWFSMVKKLFTRDIHSTQEKVGVMFIWLSVYFGNEFGNIAVCRSDFVESYSIKLQQNHSATVGSSNLLRFQTCTTFLS